MNPSFLPLIARAFLSGVVAIAQPASATESNPLEYEDDDVFMRVYLRTPDQLSAFYQARGFSRAAIDKILETCFLTPIIKNNAIRRARWATVGHARLFELSAPTTQT